MSSDNSNDRKKLPAAELEDARKRMHEMLKPRDANGNVLSEDDLKACGGKAYFPVQKPNADGTVNPMWNVQDFADGNSPPGLTYERGQLQPGGTIHNGMVIGQVRYSNPIYNLSPEQHSIYYHMYCMFEEGRMRREEEAERKRQAEEEELQRRALEEEKQRKAAEEAAEALPNIFQVFRDGAPATPVAREATLPSTIYGDLQLYESNHGMYVKMKDGDCYISNFTVHVVNCRRVYNRPGEFTEEYCLKVTCCNRISFLNIPASSMSDVLKQIQREVPSATISSGISSARKHIENAIRQQSAHVDTVDVIRCTSFIQVSGHWVYAHDKAAAPVPGVEFETGFSIACTPGVTPAQAMLEAFEFLNVCSQSEVIAPLLLLAHLGPTFELFKEADCLIRFLVGLIAPSGSFKTSLSVAMFRLFEQQGNTPDGSFVSTSGGVESQATEACGCVHVVDDLCPNVSSTDTAKKAEKLENLIRIYGDGNKKVRSSPSMKLRRSHQISCCLLFLGEDIVGSQSSLLRCLLLKLEKGMIDGTRLRVFQEHPEIMQTHLYHFLNICGQNAAQIIHFIRQEFPRQREAFSQMIREPRLVDTAAIFQVMAQIVLLYADRVGAWSAEIQSQMGEYFRQAILNAAILSESYSCELNPVVMYLQALFDLVQNGSITLARSADVYSPTDHLGYIRNDQWWLHSRFVFPEITQYWKKRGVIFPIKERNLYGRMEAAGLIETDREIVSGKEKRLYSRKSSVAGHPRMMVLNAEAAKDYLRKENNEY